MKIPTKVESLMPDVLSHEHAFFKRIFFRKMSLYDDALIEEGKRVFKLATLEEMIGTLTIPELQELYPQ